MKNTHPRKSVAQIGPIAMAAKELFSTAKWNKKTPKTTDDGIFYRTKSSNISVNSKETEFSKKPLSLGLQDARRSLATFIESGSADKGLVDAIYDGESFLPIEGLLIDYKREIPAEKFGLAKFLKHILAFHNT